MSRKSRRSLACRYPKLFVPIAALVLLAVSLGTTGCDRGASTEVETARRFADAVARNDAARRDSMIATARFREHFENPYVASDMLSWFRTFYDYHEQTFKTPATADVDSDLKRQLQGALLDPGEIEETGMVRVKSPISSEDDAMFWMVKQAGKPWKIAMVTKGELQVNFQ